MTEKKKIGMKIKMARVHSGLTQRELGKKLSRSGAAIAYMEQGKRSVSHEMVKKIALATDKHFSFFYEDEENMDQMKEKFSVLNEQLKEIKSLFSETKKQKKDSEEKYRAYVENAPDGIFVVNEKGQYLDVNNAACKLLGYTREEFLSMAIPHMLPPDDKTTLSSFSELKRRGILNIELKLLRKDKLLVDVRLDAVSLSEGKYMAFCSDISERKIVEEALKRSEEKFRKFFENNPEYCYMVSHEGKLIDINKAALKRLGYRKEEIIGKPIAKTIYSKQSQKKAKQLFKKWKKDGILENEEMTIVAKSGEERSVLLNVNSIKDSHGNLVSSISVQTDISGSKKNEEELKKSEEKYHSLFTNMMNGYAYCEMIFNKANKPVDFEYIAVNDAFEKLTGLKKEDVLGRKVTEAIPGIKDSHPELFDIYGKVASTGESTSFEIYFEPLDIWFSISVYSPKKGYFVAVFENITERKETEEALQAQKENYSSLLDNAPIGVFSINRDGEIIDINQRLLNIIGAPSLEEALKVNTFRASNFVESGITQALQDCLKTGNTTCKEFSIVSTWKKSLKLFIRFGPIKNLDGVITGVQVVVEEMSEKELSSEEDLVDEGQQFRGRLKEGKRKKLKVKKSEEVKK